MKWSEITRRQKIIAGSVSVGVVVVVAAIVVYFVFIKKDTPKPTQSPVTRNPTLTTTLTTTPTNSLLKSDKIKELEQIYKDAEKNSNAASKNYDDAVKKNEGVPEGAVKTAYLDGLKRVAMDAYLKFITAKENLQDALK